MRRNLSSSTAITGFVLLASLLGAAKAHAGGESGGAGAATSPGGAGGAGFTGNPGASGYTGPRLSGGGGGAGGYGAVLPVPGRIVTSYVYRGGNGGHGGNSDGYQAGGGGGGDGGVGLFFDAYGGSATIAGAGQILGGNGGDGAYAYWRGVGAMGGNGGHGIQGNGLTIVNKGTIQGGMAGAGGAGSARRGGTTGPDGLAGAGIFGSELSITNSGIISGGLNADSYGRANAITFTGGANRLELQAGSVITGNVVVQSGTGTLALSGTADGTFDASALGATPQYQGFTSLEKTGSGTWTVTGASSFSGQTTIGAGQVAVNGSLVNSDVRVTGGSPGRTGAVGGIVVENGGILAPARQPSAGSMRRAMSCSTPARSIR